ncbi:MAG TPA: NAD(P)H-quinone oxidoreductase [Polyangia bacterium]|jgi:putative PIG3 family NAD(P)H quinone oxidoreductase|nr:NAD(P)H-quinone oxidoreductase [Polyangia bacterium]
MRAIVIVEPGGPEVLVLRDVPAPEPGRGEVRVRVRATAVNRADLLQRMGLYPAPPDSPQQIPGLEYAGEIDALGPGVIGWNLGDRVFGLVGGGGYAEQLVTHAETLARIPPNLSFTNAAAIPEAFITAWDAMVAQAGLGAGETLLVSAVGSGVGSAAVQIARALSARALGTARTASKLARAGKLGMDRGFTVENGKFADDVLRATEGRGVDVVLELVGGAYLAEDLVCAAPRARIVLVGMMGGTRADLDQTLIMRKRLTIMGTQMRNRPLGEKIGVGQMFAHHVVPLVASGALQPIVERVFPLAEAAAAHAQMACNDCFGKIVLAVD